MSFGTATTTDAIENRWHEEDYGDNESLRDYKIRPPFDPLNAVKPSGLRTPKSDVTLISERPDWLPVAHRKLAELGRLGTDQEIEPPLPAAIERARNVLAVLADNGLSPSNIDPSGDGGICISFVAGNLYADIEFLNSGSVLAVTSDGGHNTRVWEVDDGVHSLRNTTKAILGFVSK
jgi:hypothetical protein